MFSPFQAPPNYMAHPPFAQSFAPPLAPTGQPMIGRGGGLLGRLFGGLGGASRFGALHAPPMQSMNLMSMIENTQRVLNIFQSVSPIVQQYGPLLRNIPTIYKMLKESPSATVETTNNKQKEEKKQNIIQIENTSKARINQTVQKHVPKISGNIPAPKMYV